jgi:transcriptional regulator with XRE-family HTH domain
MSIGKNLKRLRLAEDLNQTELAKRSGIDQSMIK